MRRWRPALRVARRDALRTKARSLLVLAMIGLPVAGVVAADVLVRTQSVSSAEGLDRRLGAADAEVVLNGRRPIVQAPDVNDGYATVGRPQPGLGRASAEDVAEALGPGSRAIRVDEQPVDVLTPEGIALVEATEIDLRDPMTAGLYPLESGRYPRSPGEVVVSAAVKARGIDDRLEPLDGATVAVVGVVRSPALRDELLAVGPPGSLGLREQDGLVRYLATKPGGVAWSDVQAANRRGLAVLSRQVIESPPAASAVDPRARLSGGGNDELVPVIVLVVIMALLEVVLLAGPAFAVGTRQRAQTLALMVAGGGATPADLRRTVLASGLVLGAGGALAGVGIGVLAAVLAAPLLQSQTSERFGPFEVAPLDLAGIAAFGILSAVLAAAAPAWLAARQDVVATLGGRRGDPAPSRRFPLAGLGLLGFGVAVAISGANAPSGEIRIAAATVVAVVGVVLLLPVIVTTLGRTAAALPLPLRFAVRDAARHRNRTAPAIAAIMATVVGVTALSITSSSDARQQELTYTPVGPSGAAVITGSDFLPTGGRTDAPLPWSRARAAAERVLPEATVRTVGGPGYGSQLRFSGGGSNANSNFGTPAPVVSGELASLGLGLAPADVARAEAALARGGAVVFSHRSTTATQTTLSGARRRVTVPAAYVAHSDLYAPAVGLLSPQAARRAGVVVETRSLLVSGTTIDGNAERDLEEAVRSASPRFYGYVERGYTESGPGQLVLLAVLAGVGGLLMLGGSLTASSLALSDARPDLATLAAIGAPPRTRRLIAAGYAGALGLIGAVLGTAVGLVPGLAASHALTAGAREGYGIPGARLPDSFIVVPWPLLTAVVIGLPLLTAAVAALTSRSRLPATARLA